MLSDLRESGAIEQDADIVMFIHRPDKVAEEDEIAKGRVMKNVAEILVEKNRTGATGSFELLFKGGTTKFVDLPADYKAQFETNIAGSGRVSRGPIGGAEDAPFDVPYGEDVPLPPDEEFISPSPDDDVKIGITDIDDIF